MSKAEALISAKLRQSYENDLQAMVVSKVGISISIFYLIIFINLIIVFRLFFYFEIIFRLLLTFLSFLSFSVFVFNLHLYAIDIVIYFFEGMELYAILVFF